VDQETGRYHTRSLAASASLRAASASCSWRSSVLSTCAAARGPTCTVPVRRARALIGRGRAVGLLSNAFTRSRTDAERPEVTWGTVRGTLRSLAVAGLAAEVGRDTGRLPSVAAAGLAAEVGRDAGPLLSMCGAKPMRVAAEATRVFEATDGLLVGLRGAGVLCGQGAGHSIDGERQEGQGCVWCGESTLRPRVCVGPRCCVKAPLVRCSFSEEVVSCDEVVVSCGELGYVILEVVCRAIPGVPDMVARGV
jgi:hypothetical protein